MYTQIHTFSFSCSLGYKQFEADFSARFVKYTISYVQDFFFNFLKTCKYIFHFFKHLEHQRSGAQNLNSKKTLVYEKQDNPDLYIEFYESLCFQSQSIQRAVVLRCMWPYHFVQCYKNQKWGPMVVISKISVTHKIF